MKRSITLITFLALTFFHVNAQEHLHIVHPEDWGWYEYGDIQNASILVEPEGLYAKCTLILEFSARHAGGWEEENMEVDMNFALPPNANVTDLYLWIEGKPERALIKDVWTASLIYESIVQRRIDPAILTRQAGNTYNLKVYPIRKNMPRSIKLVYSVPVSNAMGSRPSVPLPINILQLSADSVANVKLGFRGNEKYSNPGVFEMPELAFENKVDTFMGACLMAEFDQRSSQKSLNMNFENKSEEAEFFISTYEEGEGYFELAIQHDKLVNSSSHKKAVYAIDFIQLNSNAYSGASLLDELEYSIRQSFSSVDSFNILLAGGETKFLSEHWMVADSATLSWVFGNLSAHQFKGYSNLPGVLFDGVNFIEKNGNEGSIILIASSNSHGTSDQANALITDLIAELEGEKVPIHIVNLDDTYYSYSEKHRIGNTYYDGNEYLYSRLSQMTGGEYYSVHDFSLTHILHELSGRVSGFFRSLEIFIQTEGGYAYSSYPLNNSQSMVYTNDPYRVIGKYVGEAAFYISIFGQTSGGEVFHFEETLTQEEVVAGDSSLRINWSAAYLRSLFALEQTNQIVNQIISTSVQERILTNYTAFLVLEPDFVIPDEFDDPEFDEDSMWPTVAIEHQENDDRKASVKVYPNPFSETSTLTYFVPEESRVQLELFDASGRHVRTLVSERKSQGEYTAELWAHDLEKGIYFCIMTVNGTKVKNIKIVVI